MRAPVVDQNYASSERLLASTTGTNESGPVKHQITLKNESTGMELGSSTGNVANSGPKKKKQPETYPAFAAILSFLMNYAFLLGCVGEVDLKRVAAWFQPNEKVPDDFVDFLINLMKRMQRRATSETWQDTLASLYRRQSEVDSWMLRNSGFNKLPLESRLAMLKYILERQFDLNEKFRVIIESLPVEELRLSPVGTDEQGHIYWYFQDSKLNILLYREEPDDCSGDSFLLLANSLEQLTCIVNKLELHDFSLLKIEDETTKMEPKDLAPVSFLDANSRGSANSIVGEPLSGNNIAVKIEGEDSLAEPAGSETNIEFNGEMKSEALVDTISQTKVEIKEEINGVEEPLANTVDEPEVKMNGHCFPQSDDLKPAQSEEPKFDPTDSSIDQPLGNIKKRGKTTEKLSVDTPTEPETDGDLSSVVSTDDSQQRRSSRLSRSAKSCYKVEDAFKLIYKQTQKSPKKTQKKFVDSFGNEDENVDSKRSQLSEMQSEDLPLAMLGKKKRGRKPGKKKGAKRGRKKGDESLSETSETEAKSEEEEEEEIYPNEEGYEGCQKCLKKSRPDTILMCDSCDACIHMGCLRPPLMAIPEEQWFCPLCAHNKLLVALKAILESLQQQVLAASRKRRYASQPAPFGFPSVVNVATYQQPEEALGFDLPPHFTQGRTLREKRRVNYDYNEYDQEIKAAIRAQNSPFKDNMPVYRSDCDDVSSNTSYSPAKYGFRSSKRLLEKVSNQSCNSSDYSDEEDRSTEITNESFRVHKKGNYEYHNGTMISNQDDDSMGIFSEEPEEDYEEEPKRKYLCSRMNSSEEGLRLKISVKQPSETNDREYEQISADGKDLDSSRSTEPSSHTTADPDSSTVKTSSSSDDVVNSHAENNRSTYHRVDVKSSDHVSSSSSSYLAASTNISTSSTSSDYLHPGSSEKQTIDASYAPRLTMSVMTEFAPKSEGEVRVNKHQSSSEGSSEPNSEEASGPNNSDTGHSGSKTEEHKVPSISNGNQLKDVVTARNDRSGTAAFHSRNRSYQNVYANDLEMEEDEEETLDYDSSEDFVNDHNGHDESTDEFESDEFDGDLHDVWRPKKKKKVRPERTRPPPERISSRLSGKAKKTYTEETPYDEMIYDDR